MREKINGKAIPKKSCRYCHFVMEPASPYHNSTLSEEMRQKVVKDIAPNSISGLKCYYLKWGNKIIENFMIRRTGRSICRYFTRVNHNFTVTEMEKEKEYRKHRTGRILTFIGIGISLIVLFISGWTFITKTLPQSTPTQQTSVKP